jgi:hypothetical protein
MRRALLCCAVASAALVGCGRPAVPTVHTDAPTNLGRVVVYRNGVAYFERTAHVPEDTLTLSVPADRVDDFLKSLDVVDARTGEKATVAYPTDPQPTAGGMVDMRIELTGRRPHDVRLSYVTESPAWKPSYRVVLGDHEKVDLAGWAVVDNTSGEDWKNVRLGVGASSALSFHFDLHSLRPVERETLEANGLFAQAPPVGVAADGRGAQAAAAGLAQVVRRAPGPPAPPSPPGPGQDGSTDPIGTSHFESEGAMTVAKGDSAMVPVLHTSAEGEVVYLYDSESPRGSSQLAFKSLRLRNPTDSQLESGPVTVFGEGRLIGEGLSEPIPPKQVAFVPFALDRQVLVDRVQSEHDEVEQIRAVQSGVFTTQARHVLRTTLIVHNRLPSRTVVYIRHTVRPGFHASKAPTDPEKAGNADLYRVEVDGFGKQDVVLEESTSVPRLVDVRNAQGLELVKTYLATSAPAKGTLKGKVDDLGRIETDIAENDRRLSELQVRAAEHRQRIEELRAQIAIAHGAKTGGALVTSLQAKLKELGDKLAKATVDIAGLQEKQLLARIELQEDAAELSLGDVERGNLAAGNP